jgi:hypothetical protein
VAVVTAPLYEIRVGDVRVEADDLGGALLAARVLADEGSPALGGPRILRRTATIYRDGQYDGLATALARDSRTSAA